MSDLRGKKRYDILDAIRGFAVINMVAFHAMWDLVYLYGLDIPWFYGAGAHIWQRLICGSFILVSGFSAALGRRRFGRGFEIFICGALVSLVLKIAMPDVPNLFNVLTFLGSAMLLINLIKPFLLRLPPAFGAAISVLLFAFTYNVNYGYLSIFGMRIAIPSAFYSGYISSYLGFPPTWFASTDYFSLMPWIFLYLFGFFICCMMKNGDKLGILAHKSPRPLVFIGKKSLIIYMLHQPVVYGVLYLISRVGVI